MSNARLHAGSTDHLTSLPALEAEAVFALLESHPEGLSESEAQLRLLHYGSNALAIPVRSSWAKIFVENFGHLMALLLWLGGAVAFAAQLPEMGAAIWLVNLINGSFSVWQEYRAQRATEAMRRMLPRFARVLRDGGECRQPADRLVPGDVILLEAGDSISTDARVIEQSELRVDQSSLTGESKPVRKTADAIDNHRALAELSNLVFAGSTASHGAAKAVVFATGMQTQFGQIAHLTATVGDEPSPLQREMQHVTRWVTVIAVGVGLAFFLLSVLLAGMSLASSCLFALGMIVAFVPEGLLPTVTLALALGVQRIANRNGLVKRLSAVETLGCTTVVCTDKTGTLTENKMTVAAGWTPDGELSVSGVGYAPEGKIVDALGNAVMAADTKWRAVFWVCALCNDSRLVPPTENEPRWTALGDPTESALLVFSCKAGLDPGAAASAEPRVKEFPFDSHRKRMTSVHQSPAGRVAYVKGAPHEILKLCTEIRRADGDRPISDADRQEMLAANDCFAAAGLRVLALALRVLPDDENLHAIRHVERQLTLLGLVAMNDPPRPEVPAAIANCRRAGIRIIMITGDYGLTAESIARKLGMIQEQQPRIITGAELERLDEPTLAAALQCEVLFARTTPEHKLRIVTALQKQGHVVAVTGDGVNDAPALRKADVGVAMGVAGTDVAKESADMILTDDNFATIVAAIEEGRAVYANIRKFVTYIFTSNTPEAVPFVLHAFSGGRIPLALNVMQVLAIDLGTDMVPALALGAEPPEPNVMSHPPRELSRHVIDAPLLARAYLRLGLPQSLAALAAFYFTYWSAGYWGYWSDLPADGALYQSATAMTLAAVVVTQIGNLFTQRTETASMLHSKWFANRLVWIGILVELLVVSAIIYMPVLQRVFGTAPFPPAHWLFLLAWLPALIVADEIGKWLIRRKGRHPKPSNAAPTQSRSGTP